MKVELFTVRIPGNVKPQDITLAMMLGATIDKPESPSPPVQEPTSVPRDGMLAGGTFLEVLERETMRYLSVLNDDTLHGIGELLHLKLQQARFNDANSWADLDDKMEAMNASHRHEFCRQDKKKVRKILNDLRDSLDEVIEEAHATSGESDEEIIDDTSG